MSVVSRNSRRISCSWANRSVSEVPQVTSNDFPIPRLVFSSSLAQESCSQGTAVILLSSGEAKSGFPAVFFSRKRASLSFERTNAEGEFFFLRRFTGFTVTCPVTSLSSFALLEVLAWSLQLTVSDKESRLRVSFHENRLSSSPSRLFIASMIDFGITLGSSSIVIFQNHGGVNILRPLHPPFFCPSSRCHDRASLSSESDPVSDTCNVPDQDILQTIQGIQQDTKGTHHVPQFYHQDKQESEKCLKPNRQTRVGECPVAEEEPWARLR